MPAFSAFSQCGHQRFSSRPPHSQLLYEDKVRNLGSGKVYSDEWGTLVSAELYADSMLEGTTRHFLERVGSQFRPTKAVELLPYLETYYGVVPGSTATIQDRQGEVAAAAKTSRGARRENVISVLSDLLGDDFIAYFTVPAGSATVSSATPGTVGNYPKPGTLATLVRLTAGVTSLGSQTVAYEYVTGLADTLKVGQKLWVDGGSNARVETVTLTAVTATHITATFAYPHDAGTLATSARSPNLSSNKRHNLVVLSAAAVRDLEKRKRTDRTLRKLLRGVSTWSLTEETSPGVAGPFKVGVGKLGITPIGTVTL